jgi:hypothetical protein
MARAHPLLPPRPLETFRTMTIATRLSLVNRARALVHFEYTVLGALGVVSSRVDAASR